MHDKRFPTDMFVADPSNACHSGKSFPALIRVNPAADGIVCFPLTWRAVRF
jgi:hypothetical protein